MVAGHVQILIFICRFYNKLVTGVMGSQWYILVIVMSKSKFSSLLAMPKTHFEHLILLS